MKKYSLILLFSLLFHLLFGCKLETELVAVSQDDQIIIFEDDFSGDLSKWNITAGTWGIQNNMLMGIGYVGVDAWIYAGSESWTDYEISLTVYFVDGNTEIVMRSKGHREDEYRIDIFSEDWVDPSNEYCNTYAFSYYKNGGRNWIQDSLGNVYRSCPISISNPANIKVSVIGNELRLFINEVFVDSFIDSEPLNAGKFGLGVVWGGECKFDNVYCTL
jgi:hypothetical protein